MAARHPIIPCSLLPETRARIDAYVEALKQAAPTIGTHGLTPQEFQDSGIFRSAVEQIRGTNAASMAEKRAFMAEVLDHLQRTNLIRNWAYAGAGERHDYEVKMPTGRISIIETKGCLDGNNTNIFERPPQADEFIIWSLCQNPGSDPAHNAWSGIHTRLSAEIIHRRQRVDGVVIWDMVCGTAGRPCPKLVAESTRATRIEGGRSLLPPCLYCFPRTIPDPRSNPTPACWQLADVQILHALWTGFNGNAADVVEVGIEARIDGVDVQRRTRFFRQGTEISTSEWTTVRRAH
ncbi:MAG: hypothetical protein DMG37_20985 [Acidobacteria bacterium]|nr:MAG: hypothetical protein DMG37_20985 [Acidobacteriota bacterium]